LRFKAGYRATRPGAVNSIRDIVQVTQPDQFELRRTNQGIRHRDSNAVGSYRPACRASGEQETNNQDTQTS
jgi:hypothetical protein